MALLLEIATNQERFYLQYNRYGTMGGVFLTSASGRKRTLISVDFAIPERPLSGKADIKSGTPEIESENVRFTLGSGHSANIGGKVC